ncbi:MAG: hypothetical protein ABII00_04235 [Elusimicrobiota bacterium]
MWWLLEKALFGPALTGLVSAWAACSASVTGMVFARPVSTRAFWWAFGGGMALRAAVFAALVAVAWRDGGRVQAAMWGAYALGVLFLLQIEYRQLTRK